MEIITSADNSTVKHINKLKQKKYRDEYREFFIEGYKNVLDTCAAHPQLVRSVVLSESAHKNYGSSFNGFKVTVLSDALFSKITETESGQGVLSVNGFLSYEFPKSDRCVLLDRVRDPGNVGTILRTAVACGYDVVVNNCADIYSPKVTRSAMSAILKCRIGSDISIQELKVAGYEIIVADMHGESVFTAAHADKYCIVIGNEANGVSSDIVSAADRTLCLPQDGIESLNAAVAAGVMMYTLRYAVK